LLRAGWAFEDIHRLAGDWDLHEGTRKRQWLSDVIDLGNPQVVADDLPIAFVWTGLEQSFLKAGFTEVARRSPKRPILRSQT